MRRLGFACLLALALAPPLVASDWQLVTVTQNQAASAQCASLGMIHVAVNGFSSLKGLSTDVVYDRLKKEAAKKGGNLVVMMGGITKVEHGVGDADLQADGEAFQCKVAEADKTPSAEGTECAKAFVVSGSMLRGKTYKTNVVVPHVDRPTAMQRILEAAQNKGMPVTASDQARGTISAQAKDGSGDVSSVEFQIDEVPAGTNVVVSIKLGMGEKFNDESVVRDLLCALAQSAAVSQAKPKMAPAMGGQVQPPAGEKPSVEERLKKLDDLHKKGILTDKEYEKKRADILKDL
jgi:hypothetical protein